MKAPVAVVSALLFVVSCNRDPNVAKKKYLEMGDTYFKREQYKQAALLYRNALQRDQRYGMAHYKLALTQLKMGNGGGALGALRRAVELLPPGSAERTDANIKLSELYLVYAGKDKQLITDVENVAQDLLKKDPNSFDGHRLLGSVAYVKARQAYSTSHAEAGKDYLETAVAELRKADAAKPGQLPIRLALAEVLTAPAIHQYAESEKICRELIAQDKTANQPYMQLYQLLALQGRLSQSEEVLKLAVANNPKEYGYLSILARHYYLTKRREDMVKVLDQIKAHAKE